MRTGRSLFTLCAAIAASLFLTACWSYRPGSPQRLVPPVSSLPGDAWPARDMDAVRELSRLTNFYPVRVSTRPVQPGSEDLHTPREARHLVDLKVTYNQVHGQGLLRVFRPESEFPLAMGEYLLRQEDQVGFVPDSRFVTSRVLDDPRTRAIIDRHDRVFAASQRLQMSSIERGGSVDETRTIDRALLESGMAVQFPKVMDRAPRGVIIHLHSIAPNPFEPRVVRQFEDAGWAVVTLNTSTAIRTPWTPEQEAKYLELETARTDLVVGHIEAITSLVKGWDAPPKSPIKFPPSAQQQRQYRQKTKEIERLVKEAKYHADTDADIEAIARTIARETDEALASNAYAVEAVLDYLNTQRPDIAPRANHIPVVIVGMSAGALAAPAAAVRVRDQINALVLVGGGADLFRISQESSLTNGGIEILRGKRRAPRSVRDKIDALYLQTTRLDPYHTAPLLAGLPVLQVHAAWDGWVPKETGELLSKRLDHPDRMVFQGGHSMLFLFLPGHVKEIMNWIEDAAHRGPPSPTQ